MQLTNRQEFPAAPDAVFAMLTDEAFLLRAASDMGAFDAKASSSAQRTAVQATVATPAAIAPFIGPRLSILQDTAWEEATADGSRPGRFTITVPGTPVTFEGTVRLAPAASGSVVTYAGDLTVRVPLLGPRIEKDAAPAILEALDAQGRVGRAWLDR